MRDDLYRLEGTVMIPDNKKDEFNRYILQILDACGIRKTERIELDGRPITRLIEAPVPPFRTSEFLRQDDFFAFYDTPKELEGKPDYYISDDDRLYWWDGTDEVVLSKEMDEWLGILAVRHKEILEKLTGRLKILMWFLRNFCSFSWKSTNIINVFIRSRTCSMNLFTMVIRLSTEQH